MPRRKSSPPADPNQGIDAKTLEHNAAKADQESRRLAEIDARWGDGLPYERGRLIHEARFYLQQSAEAMLEAGRRLILLKEHEPHGEFLNALEHIGLAPRAAQKLMQAAAKFSDDKARLVELGKTKLLELLTEDDEQVEALADGGTLAGHTLDEIQRMTASELRAALRKERERRTRDTEVHEKLLGQKDRKINELDKRLHKQDQLPAWPQQVSEAQVQAATTVGRLLEACDQLDALRERILLAELPDDQTESATEAMAVAYLDAVSRAWGRFGEVLAAAEEVFGGYKGLADERDANAPEPPLDGELLKH